MTLSTPTNSPYFTVEELVEFGFSTVGNNCKISRKCSFYCITGEIGNNVRIDDFCIIKGRVTFQSYIHVGAYTLISGVGGDVLLENCSTLSSGVHVYSASDDYSATALSSTSVPQKYTVTRSGPITFHAGSLVGAYTLILPNSVIGHGASVGAHCIVYGHIPDGAVVASRNAIGKIINYRDTKKIADLVQQVIKPIQSASDKLGQG